MSLGAEALDGPRVAGIGVGPVRRGSGAGVAVDTADGRGFVVAACGAATVSVGTGAVAVAVAASELDIAVIAGTGGELATVAALPDAIVAAACDWLRERTITTATAIVSTSPAATASTATMR
jgi:hypothetical protein